MHRHVALAFGLHRLAFPLGLSCLVFGIVSLEGCSRQNEGERCSLLNGNRDCDGSLLCTEASILRRNDGIDRCCPRDRDDYSDDLCAPRSATGGDGDAQGGASGDGDGDGDGDGPGSGNMGGTDDGAGLPENSLCNYHSSCQEGLYCISGVCRVQCSRSIDCEDFGGGICNAEGRCVDE